MKLVVFSDNHRDKEVVNWIVNHNLDADRIISLGDSEMKEHELSGMGIFGVKGNYPFEPDFPNELVMEFEDIRFFITHGHRYFVKTGFYNIQSALESRNCDVALFGHTHQAIIEKIDHRLLLNPGSTTHPKLGAFKTYMIIEVIKRIITIEIREVYTDQLIRKHIETLPPRRKPYGF